MMATARIKSDGHAAETTSCPCSLRFVFNQKTSKNKTIKNVSTFSTRPPPRMRLISQTRSRLKRTTIKRQIDRKKHYSCRHRLPGRLREALLERKGLLRRAVGAQVVETFFALVHCRDMSGRDPP